MFYTIYKITNLINGKFYIGKHQTKDLNDNYFGSGKLLKRAISKYGKENFKKEILEIFDTEEKMNLAEKILVISDTEVSYNLCPGGHGGFGYINTNHIAPGWTFNNDGSDRHKQRARNTTKKRHEKFLTDPVFREYYSKKISDGLKNHNKKYGHNWLGKKHKAETKQKIGEANSKHQSGKNNSQFGTMWITNGIENQKVKKDILYLPEGWYKGRLI